MVEAADLANCLPRATKTPKEQQYIEFPRDEFDTNYTHGNCQFAVLVYDTLTMSGGHFNI